MARATSAGLQTIVCAGTQEDAVRVRRAAVRPSCSSSRRSSSAPAAAGPRDWIGPSTEAVHRAGHDVLAMHAGGVSSPAVAEAIMAAGADGTGSTSGVLNATDPARRRHGPSSPRRAPGWDAARTA